MCLIPKLYVAAIYGDVQQPQPVEPETPPEETPADEALESDLVLSSLV
jgi:hypothetical protein